jgi:gas vesicle protein
MFPFRKTPATKAELAKKKVSEAAHAIIDVVPTEAIEDKFDDLKKSAVAIALQAAQAAHHASEVAAHKLEDLQHAASTFGESASEAAHRATDAAHNAAHRASDSAHVASEAAAASAAIKAKAAKEAAQNAKEAALAARDSLQERAGVLKDSAVALKSSIQERAIHDLEAGKAEALHAKAVAEKTAKRGTEAVALKAAAVGAVAEAAKAKFAGKKEEVEDQIANVEVPAIKVPEVKLPQIDTSKLPNFKSGNIEVEYSENGSKWLWIFAGLAVGVVIALLFAPTSGRRSRAAIKDRLSKVGDGAQDAAAATSDKVVDIAQRVEGIAHKVEAKLNADAETDDDSTIADRVRSTLGHLEAAKPLERINVDCNEGIITLRGPIVDQATQDTLIAAVKTIPGVKDVVSDLLIDEPVDPATSAA